MLDSGRATLDFETTAQAALAACPGLVQQWLPGGKLAGAEYEIGDVQGNPGSSLKINIKTGRWADFAADLSGGDLISLRAAIDGTDQGKALRTVAQELGIDSPAPAPTTGTTTKKPAKAKAKSANGAAPAQTKQQPQTTWTPVHPVPDDAPAPEPRHPKHGWPTRTWTYRDAQGRVLGLICRFDHADELDEQTGKPKKDYLPYTYCRSDDGRAQWRWLSFAKPRPLYGLDALAARPDGQVIVTEGEKAADAAAALFPNLVAVSWPGGSKAARMVDFAPLAGRKVVLWPDADQPGIQCMDGWVDERGAWHDGVGQMLQALGCGVRVIDLAADHDLPKGWDAADFDPVERGGAMAWCRARLRMPSAPLAVDEDEEPPMPDQPPIDGVPLPAEPYDVGEPGSAADALASDLGAFFRAIGYNKGRFFFITKYGQQVIALTAAQCAQKANLFQLAPLQTWERWAVQEKSFSGKAVDAAANHLIQSCYAAGVYTPDRLRGRGAWWDEGRVILHCGDHLLVDCQPCGLTDIRSAYVYEAGPRKRPPARAPLDLEEAQYIYDTARGFRWENRLSGILLAGFVALARAGGALQWRPHIWLTGPRGCGKSVVLRSFVQALCGDWYLDIEGDASSAYIRQSLDSEAFAVTYDENEAKSQAGMARLQQVLSLVRSASREGSGGIGRGGQDGQPVDYRIRSCFAIASIYVNMEEAADFSRTSVLALRAIKGQPKEEWDEIERALEWLKDPLVADGLFARTLCLLPIIRENQRRYAEALRKLSVGDQRFGDQIGTLLAGAHSLLSERHVAPEAAEAWIKDLDWTDYIVGTEAKDEANCLLHLLQYPLQVETDHARLTRTIGELWARVAEIQADPDVNRRHAQDTLRRNGMRVDFDQERGYWCVAVAHKHLGLSRIFRDTQYAVDYARMLKRLPFASSDRAKPRFLPPDVDGKKAAGKTSAVFLKLEDALDME